MTRNFLTAALIVASLTSMVAAEPVAKIDAPAKIEVGQLLQLSPGESTGDHFTWLVIPETPDFIIVGDTCFFSARKAGQVIFVLASSDDTGIAITSTTVTIGTGPPPAVHTLADDCHQWVATVETQNKEVEARALATAFKTVLAKIGAGVIKTPEDVVTAQIAANSKALNADALERWLPWRQLLADYLDAKALDGELPSAQEYGPIWDLIVEGLGRVSQ